jgi:tetratricopeptide (TPR) repeat protein
MLFSGCASKRLAKKGLEHQKAGFYSDAAGYFYQALLKNDDNLDAKIGLKNTGQQVLNDHLVAFDKAFRNQESDIAVYNYMKARNYFNKVEQVGVKLDFPEKYVAYFEEVKHDHLQSSYQKGYKLLMEERFTEAEEIFNEIYDIDKDYKNVQQLLREARYETLYRNAQSAMNDGKYRKAYDLLEEILIDVAYKNAEYLKEQCLEKGQVTIALLAFENSSGNPRAATIVRSKLESKLNRMTNPFLRIVDRSLTEEIMDEQEINMAGIARNSGSFDAEQLDGIKAFLQSTVLQHDAYETPLSHEQKRGYLKKESKFRDKETGKTKTRVTYDKVTYEEYSKKSSASCQFSFKLVSAENGQILASDVLRASLEDEMHYVDFEGDTKNLVPGYWKYKRRDTRSDVIKDNYSDVRKLQRLAEGKRSLKSPDVLSEEAVERVALDAARKINAYNPE